VRFFVQKGEENMANKVTLSESIDLEKDTLKSVISELIVNRKKEQKWSSTQLANRSETNQLFWTRAIQGYDDFNPTLTTLLRVAKGLDLEPDVFMKKIAEAYIVKRFENKNQ